MSRIVVVSNRVPAQVMGAQAGGLAVALKAALTGAGGLWFGWSGAVHERPAREPAVDGQGPFALATIDLDPEQVEGYYNGFANRALWPLLHSRLDLAAFESAQFDAYRRVNEVFAARLRPLLRPGDRVWVHDYHLIPLGRMLRGAGVAAPIGFFLHTPFPPPGLLSALPWHAELVHALSAYDLIGFQTRSDWRNFADLIEREFGGAIAQDGTVSVFGRRFRTGVFPIGVDAGEVAEMAASGAAARLDQRLEGCIGEGTTILGVERLDYTKGLAERLRAFELLLERAPRLRRRVSLIQIAAPSRETVPEYAEMRAALEAMSGHINGRFGEFDWTPVRYLNRSFGRRRLAVLYRLCKVGLVTPLRDGMNLVAKEYVAAQDPDDPGVLVLSRFAGAADELTGALMVNPHDVEGVARALEVALEMPPAERALRWRRMIAAVRGNDAAYWSRSFLDALETARSPGPLFVATG